MQETLGKNAGRRSRPAAAVAIPEAAAKHLLAALDRTNCLLDTSDVAMQLEHLLALVGHLRAIEGLLQHTP